MTNESRDVNVFLAERLFGKVGHVWERAGRMSPFNPMARCTQQPHGGVQCYPTNPDDLEGSFAPSYASNWKGAGEVLEAMREQDWWWDIETYAAGDWGVVCGSLRVLDDKGESMGTDLPHAICEAAVRAIEARDVTEAMHSASEPTPIPASESDVEGSPDSEVKQ